jgi:predicted nucleotidyltransferase component of viral defense system
LITVEEIKDLSKYLNIAQLNVIEKDWVLSHLLNAIYGNQIFSRNLIFKGGTSLRKCWFENYRFSEDLDFTIANYEALSYDVILRELDSIVSDWVFSG